MADPVVVYGLKVSNVRRGKVSSEVWAGVCKVEGIRTKFVHEYTPGDEYRYSACLFYGMDGSGEAAFRAFRSVGKDVCIMDLGYFKRTTGGDKSTGYQRVSVNAIHPSAYIGNLDVRGDRWKALGIQVKSEMLNNRGKYVLVAGLGRKSLSLLKNVDTWDDDIVSRIRRISSLPIWYRPKPAPPGRIRQLIPEGTVLDSFEVRSAVQSIVGSSIVVSHHSNMTLEALVEGVPVYCEDGAALSLSTLDIADIENPRMPSYDERLSLMQRVAYCQWNNRELRDGMMWRYLRDSGLVSLR